MKTIKKHLILPVVALSAFTACHDTKAPEEKVHTAFAPPQQAAVENEATITHPCAVLYSPDSIKLEKLKKDNGEEAFYTIADDNQNYMADARNFLEGKGVNILEPASGKLTFHSPKNHPTELDLNDKKYNWEIWLYDGNKLHKVDVTDIENEYAKYMK
ncbi:hypothetical protein [Chitinophaga sp. Ak27]|uniref:hypothetical protein n=1 Tax=Chitinophaga sp. Ak27 TaxID=2726116 RepID=UPI00145CA395|nr:hypothetical protein [Chitinophaga sp. Ak27]NLU96049.1 hypothetical protein [Chitinophaga sp. Ak27]